MVTDLSLADVKRLDLANAQSPHLWQQADYHAFTQFLNLSTLTKLYLNLDKRLPPTALRRLLAASKQTLTTLDLTCYSEKELDEDTMAGIEEVASGISSLSLHLGKMGPYDTLDAFADLAGFDEIAGLSLEPPTPALQLPIRQILPLFTNLTFLLLTTKKPRKPYEVVKSLSSSSLRVLSVMSPLDDGQVPLHQLAKWLMEAVQQPSLRNLKRLRVDSRVLPATITKRIWLELQEQCVERGIALRNNQTYYTGKQPTIPTVYASTDVLSSA